MEDKKILQSVTFPDAACGCMELFFHIQRKVGFREDSIYLKGASCCDTHTYMNLFDAGAWSRYTGIRKWKLAFMASGAGAVSLFCVCGDARECVRRLEVSASQESPFVMEFEAASGLYSLTAETVSGMCLSGIVFRPAQKVLERAVHLGIVICTFRRREAVGRLIRTLTGSAFFKEDSPLYGKMSIRVVDNASELPERKDPYLKIYHNPNTGGSGGFGRGMEKTRAEEAAYGITHVVLMDDDVEVLPETFYRLYALLSLMKPEYRDEVVAGRMFRMDDRRVQYTASEIWNGGDIRHVGWNLDMTEKCNLEHMNEANGEYSGWWFACFPMDYVRENSPLPFFLHCDDAEYGLRHGGKPVVLNGIQVWHETYEYRQSPVIAYYDMRNMLIVNAVHGSGTDPKQLYGFWKKVISEFHVKKDYLSEYMSILGMWHFITFSEIFWKRNTKKDHERLTKKKYFLSFRNHFFWRFTGWMFKKTYIKVKRKWRLQRALSDF